MDRSICLALDVDADAATVFQAVSTTAGQRAFWTADCEVEANRARFGFAVAPVDRMSVLALSRTSWSACTSPPGFPSWEGSTWEWEIGGSGRSETGTGVLFRHDGFGDGYAETDLAYTAHTWAMILDRLSRYVTSGPRSRTSRKPPHDDPASPHRKAPAWRLTSVRRCSSTGPAPTSPCSCSTRPTT